MALEKLKKTFVIERKSTSLGTKGNRSVSWVKVGELRGILTDAKPDERVRWQQLQHPVTHQIAQEKAPIAKQGDRLTFSGRHFYVQGVQNPGELNLWTIYECEEREDA